MNIVFTDKKLEILANDDHKMLKVFGKIRATIFRRRLTQLADALTLEDVRHLPGNYHELKSNRKGEWACDLDQPYRLLFTPQETPIPVNADGQYLWTEIKGIVVVKIINYHKEK